MPAGTRPGRLRRHCVIGCTDPGENPVGAKIQGHTSMSASQEVWPRACADRPGTVPARVLDG